MLFYTLGQSLAFLLMLKSGLMIALLYELLSLLRRLFEPGFALSLLLDLTFGAASAALLIAHLCRALNGELRLYALLGALCGFILCRAALSPLLRRLFSCLQRGFSRFSKALARSRFVQRLLK